MKNDTVEITVKIEIPIQTLKYLFDICNKYESESTECNDSVVTIKPNNITIVPETVSNNSKLQSNTNYIPSYKLYDTNPELFLEVYTKFMNDELSAPEAANLLGCSAATFNNMITYYRNKENINEIKYRTGMRRRSAKYKIYDTNPELFLEIYTKFMNKKITGEEAAKELDMSVNTFYKSMEYYEAETGIKNFG